MPPRRSWAGTWCGTLPSMGESEKDREVDVAKREDDVNGEKQR
jgi:hypothetical protein